MRTIEWEAPVLATLAAAHWVVAYEREEQPRKQLRYEAEIEFEGVAYLLMCEIGLVERERKAVSREPFIYPPFPNTAQKLADTLAAESASEQAQGADSQAKPE